MAKNYLDPSKPDFVRIEEPNPSDEVQFELWSRQQDVLHRWSYESAPKLTECPGCQKTIKLLYVERTRVLAERFVACPAEAGSPLMLPNGPLQTVESQPAEVGSYVVTCGHCGIRLEAESDKLGRGLTVTGHWTGGK